MDAGKILLGCSGISYSTECDLAYSILSRMYKAFSDNEVFTVLGLGLRVVRAQIVELPRFGAVGFGAYGFGVYLWVQRFHHLGL